VAGVKPAAKILRVLGPKDDSAWERALIGIYDYLDGLTTVAFRQGVTIETPIVDVAAYTTIQTVGLGTFPKRRVANFAGPFLISDNIANARTDIDVGLFGPFIKGLVPASNGHATDFLRGDGTWAASTGGITQLTGDVTAGPGSGSQAASLARIPGGTPALGSILFTNIAAPTTPASGKMVAWCDSTQTNFTVKDNLGNLYCAVVPAAGIAHQWVKSFAASGVLGFSQPSFADISGTVGSTQWGPLTGDVTTSGYVASLANIPSDTPMAGDLLATAMASPGAPVAGKGRIYFDSTSLNLAAKNTSGVVNHGVQTRAAVASNWIRSIADDGSSTISQPDFTDISGSIALSQLGSGTALSVLGQPANSSGTRSDIAATAGSGFALRESGSTIGWGTLATAAYGANTVTYPKIQNVTGNTLLGRGSGGGGQVQELSVSGAASFTASTFKVGKQYTLAWGGRDITGTTLASSSFYIGMGGATQWATTFFGFRCPNDSTLQDWGFGTFQDTLSGTGSPIWSLQVVLNGTPVITLGNFFAGGGGAGTAATTQVFAAGDQVGIRISVASGSINSGVVGLYVVGRFQE
jgi:hypothetical protein